MKYGVSSVPHIVINDSVEFVGAYPEEQFVNEVLKAV
jgi:predicted DsbA family dithiol-disulfide isomerase